MSSFLVRRIYELETKKLADLEIEDLRLLIGQNISLQYLMPLAIEHLKENVMAEGDYYEGDLLQKVLSMPQKFWNDNKVLKEQLKQTLGDRIEYIESFNTSKVFKTDLDNFLNS